MAELRPHLAALAIGAVGATLVGATGLPAGALIGASLSVAVAAASGMRLALYPRLRDVAFGVIGISLGAGIGPEMLDRVGEWTISLAVLAASLLATMVAGIELLRRGFGLDRETALLASAPGTMSNAIAIAAEGRGDAVTVTVLQVLRLVALIALVPPAAAAFGAPEPLGAQVPIALPALAVLLAITLALGLAAGARGVPAACLLVGMVASAVAHLLGWVEGPAPGPAIAASFTVAGVAVGVRFSAVTPAQLGRLGVAAMAVLAVVVAVSLAFTAVTVALTDLPAGQVWLAYAPGGVEAMAAIGLALGYDPAYVALHHFLRIVLLLVLVPLMLGRRRG